jgi:hypothetical protein
MTDQENLVKGSGSSSDSFQECLTPLSVTLRIGSSCANSAANCLQAPQGATGLGTLATITSAARRQVLLCTAAVIAALSAQMLKLNETFSILAPLKIPPESVNTAAPTGKFE